MSMLHAILSILVGVLGGLSARVIFSFAASIALLPLSLFSSRREAQVSTVQAALALFLLVIAVSLYDFAVIKSWKVIVEHLTWGDYIGIVVFCISSACIPDSRAADMAGDCKYNSMILNAGVYFSLFIPVGFLLMGCSENIWSYLSFIIVFLLLSFFLIDFHCFKASMKQIFTDGNNYPKLEIEKNRWTGRWWRMIAIIISVCSLTVFSVVQLFNEKNTPAHENESVELDHTRLVDLGEQYLNKGDAERAASCGNAEAQRLLGDCYFWGEGIREDTREAVKWYRLAAGQGDASAQRSLGGCYFFGNGIREDKQEAVKWFRLAAGQGDAEAQRMLGDCYFFGNGVGKNKREAVNWYFLSAKKGNAEAQRRLGACFYFGHGVAKNRQEAIRWYRLAAEQGNTVAISMLKKLGVM